MDARAYLEEHYPDLLVADGFDEAILGVAERAGGFQVVAYDTSKCLKILEERDGMTPEGAREFFDYNVIGAYVGDKTPVFIETLVPAAEPTAVTRYSQTLANCKQKRVREHGSQHYYLNWVAPAHLVAKGFSAQRAQFQITHGAIVAIVSNTEVVFMAKTRFPADARLLIIF